MKSDDLESGFSTLRGDFGFGGGAGRPETDAPGEGRSVSLPGVRDLVHRVIRQVGERKRSFAFLKSKSKSFRHRSCHRCHDIDHSRLPCGERVLSRPIDPRFVDHRFVRNLRSSVTRDGDECVLPIRGEERR